MECALAGIEVDAITPSVRMERTASKLLISFLQYHGALETLSGLAVYWITPQYMRVPPLPCECCMWPL